LVDLGFGISDLEFGIFDWKYRNLVLKIYENRILLKYN